MNRSMLVQMQRSYQMSAEPALRFPYGPSACHTPHSFAYRSVAHRSAAVVLPAEPCAIIH